jgi:hypothetical protein
MTVKTWIAASGYALLAMTRGNVIAKREALWRSTAEGSNSAPKAPHSQSFLATIG